LPSHIANCLAKDTKRGLAGDKRSQEQGMWNQPPGRAQHHPNQNAQLPLFLFLVTGFCHRLRDFELRTLQFVVDIIGSLRCIANFMLSSDIPHGLGKHVNSKEVIIT
jgi:hypothetical protein